MPIEPLNVLLYDIYSSDLFLVTQDWTMETFFSAIFVLCLSYVSNTPITQDIKLDIVNLHNTLRRHFAHGQMKEGLVVANMKQLVWSTTLEQRARTTIRLNCSLSFLNVASYHKFTNVAWDSYGNFSFDILNWYNEIRRYSVNDNACFPIGSCPHAITMLNATQGHIGCAYRRDCIRGRGAFICIYDNNNNNDTDLLWDPLREFLKQGPLCSQCSTPTSFCDDGLCTSCDIRSENCDCRKTCSAPGIGSGTLNSTACSCTCQYGAGLNCDQQCVDTSATDFYYYDICSTMTQEECEYFPEVRQGCAKTCGVCRTAPEA
ncbi:hypothetical protein ACF0H5_006045 [Mactra antiquata]